jgi:hypothetical protein
LTQIIIWKKRLSYTSGLELPRYAPLSRPTYTAPINRADIAARNRRLERLSVGMAKEIFIWQECNDLLLYVESGTFLEGMRAAYSGIEAAQVALVNAKQRLAEK